MICILKRLSNWRCMRNRNPQQIFWFTVRWIAFLSIVAIAVGLFFVCSNLIDLLWILPLALGIWGMTWVWKYDSNRDMIDWYVEIPARSIVLYQDGSIVQQAETVIYWSWDERATGFQLVPWTATSTCGHRQLSPVTDNPKVRFLKYTVKFETDGAVQTCLNIGKALGNMTDWPTLLSRKMSSWLEFQLYELNEAKSRDIGSLYNPLDQDQQLKFKNLVADFLNPRLPEELKGLVTLTTAHFGLIEQA